MGEVIEGINVIRRHKCPDGFEYEWMARVPYPKNCPRCKMRMDYNKKED